MFLGGCPCCGKKECWRCYGKYCLIGDKVYVPSVQLLAPESFTGYKINTSEEYGWVAGSAATSTDFEVRPPCNFQFVYVNGDIESPKYTFFKVDVFLGRPEGMVVSFQSPCGEAMVSRDFDGFEGRFRLNNITTTVKTPDEPISVGDNIFQLETYWNSDRFGLCPINVKLEEFPRNGLPDFPAEKYQCFEAPPDEDGWLPIGDCHATETECSLSCPSVPFCQCEEPNVLGNEITMTLQEVKDTGYTPTEAENITCTPDELISEISDLSFHAPFLFWRWRGVPENILPPPDGTDFDEAVWGTDINDPQDGLQASAKCADLGGPSINNPISCGIDKDLGTSCLKYFEEDQGFLKVEWTPSSVTLSVGGTQAGNDQRICDFSNTGRTLLEFPKLFFQDPFFINARWENLNYVSDEQKGPQFKNVRLAEFTSDMLLSVNGTPPGGRAMPQQTKGPGTYLKNMLGWFGINAKEKGCSCRHWQVKMDRWGAAGCRLHREEILDHLAKESKKRGLPFVRIAADRLLEVAIRRAEK